MDPIYLEAKIKKPRLSDSFISRGSLLAQLEESEGRLVILHATMGYGKTVLMNMYGDFYKQKQAWYHLTETDNDIMLFLEYLTASVRMVLPEFVFGRDHRESMDFDGETREDIFIKAGQDFASALQQVLGGERFCLMLDDFQVIDSPKIHGFLASFLGALPWGTRVFITTRGTMPRFALRLLLGGEAFVLRAEELCFSENEIGEILLPLQGIKDREETARVIYEYTQGWPAGVMFLYLYLKSWRGDIGWENIKEICRKSMVHDFIMYEFFKKLPFGIQQFLVRTSILEYLRSNVCNVVAQVKNAGSILDYLIREGIFIQKIENDVNTYRYHQLFRNFLRSQLSRQEEKELLKRAAAYCLKNGEKEQAVEFAIGAGDRELVALAVETAGEELLKAGKLQLFRHWMDALCEETLQKQLSPQSLLMMARYWRLMGEEGEGLLLLDTALKRAGQQGAEGVRIRIFAEKAEWLLAAGEAVEALRECRDQEAGELRTGHRHWFLLKWLELRALVALGQEEEAFGLSERIFFAKEKYGAGESRTVKEIRQNAKKIQMALGGRTDQCRALLEDLSRRERMPEAWDIAAAKSLAGCCEAWVEEIPDSLEEALSLARIQKAVRPISSYTVYGYLTEGYLLFRRKQYEEAARCFQIASGYWNPKQLAGWLANGRLLPELRRIFMAMESGYQGRDSHLHLMFSFFGSMKATVLETGDRIKWRTRKAQECVAFLIQNRQKSFSREELTSMLWDVDGLPANEVAAFHNLLSSIRKSLGPFGLEELILYDNGRYSVKKEYLYTELEQAERIKAAVEAEDGEKLSRLEHFLESFAMRPYLVDFDSFWAREQREHYEMIFARGLFLLGDYYRESGVYKKAENMLKKAMELAPYLEDAQIGLLRLYDAQKDWGGLSVIYERICAVWESEPGTVSKRLLQVYGEIVENW